MARQELLDMIQENDEFGHILIIDLDKLSGFNSIHGFNVAMEQDYIRAHGEPLSAERVRYCRINEEAYFAGRREILERILELADTRLPL